MRCVIVVHPYSLAQEDTALLTGICFPLVCKNMHGRTHVSLQTCTKTSVYDVEQETEERNIQ